jgi:hypothetical protein
LATHRESAIGLDPLHPREHGEEAGEGLMNLHMPWGIRIRGPYHPHSASYYCRGLCVDDLVISCSYQCNVMPTFLGETEA